MAQTFEGSLRSAARIAQDAVHREMKAYDRGHRNTEEEITGSLLGRLDEAFNNKRIGGLTWTAAPFSKHTQEKLIGADLGIHVRIDSPEREYAKGVIVQAKRTEVDRYLRADAHADLLEQCRKMLDATPAAFVWNYATTGMSCGSASRIFGMKTQYLSAECTWTPYRFFYEFFRSPVGDPRITGPKFTDLPVPFRLELEAVDHKPLPFRRRRHRDY